MTELTHRQKSFIGYMEKSEEHARQGFELLLNQNNFELFFDSLDDAGLFNPQNNPAPEPSGQEGFVHIRYWAALDYLKAVAMFARERKDSELSEKVLKIIRAVSREGQSKGSMPDNYHTCRIFAEIFGLLPSGQITNEDLALIEMWLKGKYDQGMVASALEGAISSFLQSESSDDWEKACKIMDYCTAIVWRDEEELEKNQKKPVTVVKDFWLKKLIEQHSISLGAKIGREIAEIFCTRLRETFDLNRRKLPSWMFRPAIEDHEQNHEWNGPENRLVEGLRNVLLGWVECNPTDAMVFVKNMLADEAEIIRRIGIFILNKQWPALKSIYPEIIKPELFDTGHLHELYQLFREYFGALSEEEKTLTLNTIRGLTLQETTEDAGRHERYIQRLWLSSCIGKGYEPVETWYSELNADPALGQLSEHPDFHSYMETWSGPGPSPYRPEELLGFAKKALIVARLNSFKQQDIWRGPTTRALVDALEEAVKANPLLFVEILTDFLEAKRPFQYGLINGFMEVWGSADSRYQLIDWEFVWVKLITFFEQLLASPTFWEEEVINDQDLTPTRDWIPPQISLFLRSGTRKEKKLYPSSLLPQVWNLIKILLEKSEADKKADEKDPMHQAINSAKGKAIEALFSLSFRECLMMDESVGNHVTKWAEICPIFEHELSKCQNANFEFSTLSGANIINFEYLDSAWLEDNIENFFPSDFPLNFTCAVEGLAYASASSSIYDLLVDRGVLNRALHQNLNGEHGREKIIQRMALAYLWGKEELSSPRFSYIFQNESEEDLKKASGFFGSLSNQDLNEEYLERILSFWERCIQWSHQLDSPPTKLLSKLSLLSCYIKSIGEREEALLLAVAPYVPINYETDRFFEELNRLVELNPPVVNAALKLVLKAHKPTFDFQDTLKTLIQRLNENGMRQDAIDHAEQLRYLPGVPQLYAKLISS